MLTIDEVCDVMLQRFTEATGRALASGLAALPPTATVPITAAEWNALAQGVYLRDALEGLVAHVEAQPDYSERSAKASAVTAAVATLAPHRRA